MDRGKYPSPYWQFLLQSGRALLSFTQIVGGYVSIYTYEGASEADELRSGLLEQADKVFDCHCCYNPENGRVTLLKSIILR